VTATATELNTLDGITATTAELNKLDGVTWTLVNYNTLTATAAELNKLDGVTATTAELNTLDGITATTAELNTLDGITATTAELNKLDGVTWSLTSYNTLTATAAELNKLDGVTWSLVSYNGLTATAAELNELDGVSSIGGDLVRAADAAAQRTVLGLDSLVVPSGAVFWFAANSPPTGYLECDGSAVSRSTYAALFAVVGTTFGVGDGSTTFDLPDLRGEFVRGWDNGRGVDSGRTFGSSQADEFEAHTHQVEYQLGGTDAGTQTTRVSAVGAGGAFTDSGSTGGAETRPRNIALLPCIKT
jgi:microcystin-dependent protein